jgi:hypothetical protein
VGRGARPFSRGPGGIGQGAQLLIRLCRPIGRRTAEHQLRDRQAYRPVHGSAVSCMPMYLAQSEGYVLACYRYIELNPVGAAMVAHPRD